jgi:hypothetical protein
MGAIETPSVFSITMIPTARIAMRATLCVSELAGIPTVILAE